MKRTNKARQESRDAQKKIDKVASLNVVIQALNTKSDSDSSTDDEDNRSDMSSEDEEQSFEEMTAEEEQMVADREVEEGRMYEENFEVSKDLLHAANKKRRKIPRRRRRTRLVEQ